MLERIAVRPARPDDLEAIAQMEVAADARFREVGLDVIADAPAPDGADFAPSQAAGRLLVAVDTAVADAVADAGATSVAEGESLLGFVRMEIVDGHAHVQQVSVDPRYAGRRLGAQLLTAAEEWARARGHDRITLTTFRDVPWNGPYYARLGWSILEHSALEPELREARRLETEGGFDVQPRQAMGKAL